MNQKKFSPQKYHRRSIRYPRYDYTNPGAYFITICTNQRYCLFGDIVDRKMYENIYGATVRATWQRLPSYFKNLTLDVFVVMPNHIHGILCLEEPLERMQIDDYPSYFDQKKGTYSGSIPAIIQNFKSISTRKINQLRGSKLPLVWQRNFYDHINRNDQSLNRIRQYILENPYRWEEDEENPNFLPF